MTSRDPQDEYESIADLYDSVVLYAERPDIAFYVDAARASGGPVLEIGCGTGRVLIPTARAGVEIVGVDLSPRMLSVCRERLRQETEAVRARATLVHGDMRAFDLARTFALVTLPFRPFQHLVTEQDQRAALENVRRHLTDSGRLIVDLFNPSLDALATRPIGAETEDGPPFTTPDGRHVARTSRIVSQDRFNQVSQVELIYYVTHLDGRKERLVHAFPMRYVFRFEMEHLLARCGFEVEHLYAGFDRSAYGSMYPGELVFVAKKR